MLPGPCARTSLKVDSAWDGESLEALRASSMRFAVSGMAIIY